MKDSIKKIIKNNTSVTKKDGVFYFRVDTDNVRDILKELI